MARSKEEAEVVVRGLLDKAYRRFKQELAGDNEEFLDRVLRQFRAKVARYIWKNSQQWSKWDDAGPVLMPDFTRIYYRKGGTEILLQEFPPQVRLLKFRGGLVNRGNSTDPLSSNQMNSIHHFSLALPYVVFLFRFVHGAFTDVKCAFCDRPLKRLDERPLRPYFSNIDNTLGVCLGASFDRSQLQTGNVTQQASLVLSHFWHSSYTDEWSSHYWQTKQHFESQPDQRMITLDAWQTASEENPLFVVEDVKWLQYQEESFGDMIVKMLDNDKANHDLHEELYSGLTDEFFDNLKKTFSDNIEAVAVTDALVSQLTEELVEKL